MQTSSASRFVKPTFKAIDPLVLISIVPSRPHDTSPLRLLASYPSSSPSSSPRLPSVPAASGFANHLTRSKSGAPLASLLPPTNDGTSRSLSSPYVPLPSPLLLEVRRAARTNETDLWMGPLVADWQRRLEEQDMPHTILPTLVLLPKRTSLPPSLQHAQGQTRTKDMY
jgi:hypothetical protein